MAARAAGAILGVHRSRTERTLPMSAVQEPPVASPQSASTERETASGELAEMRNELHEQGKSIRSAQQAFSIFAVMAFVLATATLLAVAFKLQRHPTMTVTAAPTAAASATALPRNVDVTLAQFAVSPSAPGARGGRVTFRVHNAGTITHEFVVIKTPTLAADLPVKAGRAVESGNVGETGDLKPGVTKSVAIALPAGHYALICNLPGHYLAGQHTDFTVQ
jgi:uncharacterized cupredoxin-like copper-binding protein